MDTIEYGHFANEMPQSFQFVGYGSNTGLFQQDGSAIPAPIESRSYNAGYFDYTCPPAAPQTGLTPILPTSASPPSAQQSRLPHESLRSAQNPDMEDRLGRRSSSEEKENTSPAQSRRKAQNRAAQRAFRERKERHVRDLEHRLDQLLTTTSSLQSDNERLKLMVRRAQSENEILRSKASSSLSRRQPAVRADNPRVLQSQHRSQSANSHSGHYHTTLSGLLPGQKSPAVSLGEKGNILSANEVLDILQVHPLFLSGTLDVDNFCQRLKTQTRCDGTGPVFDQAEVCAMIEEFGRSCGRTR